MRILCLTLLLGSFAGFCAQADDGPLQKFQGRTSQTTSAFTVQDKWEVRWFSMRSLNIAVLADDGTLTAGAAGSRGALYLPKGGHFHLQIDYAPAASPSRGGASANGDRGLTGLQNTIDNGNGGGSSSPSPGGSPPNSQPPPNNNYPPSMSIPPWQVEVVEMSSAAAKNSSFATENFTVPESVASAPAQNAPAPGNPPPPPGAPNAGLTEDQARAVVLIKGDNAEGTGFMIKTPEGPAVVTNIHVIANNPNLKITTSSGALVKVLSMKGASDRDLALVAIEDANYSYLPVATDISKTVQTGDAVVTPGNSQGGEVMLNTQGQVLGIGPERIEFNNPIYHGNSGGPVFHSKSGQVLGVVTEAMKVDISNDLDKASFASRNSAISGAMRYFGLRLDTVTAWVPIDSRRFQIETAFLDQFHEQSRRLDAYLNTTDNNQSGDSSSGNNNGNDVSKIYLSDEKIMKANDDFTQQASGSDTSQRIDALRILLFDLQSVADLNVNQIQNAGNFYSFDQERAREELDYRKALKDELTSIGNNVERLGGLPRTNN